MQAFVYTVPKEDQYSVIDRQLFKVKVNGMTYRDFRQDLGLLLKCELQTLAQLLDVPERENLKKADLLTAVRPRIQFA
jgi:hypothetical protein